MQYEKTIRINTGSVLIHFEDNVEYKKYLSELKKYLIYIILSIFLILVGTFGIIYFIYNYNFTLIITSFVIEIIGIIVTLLFEPILKNFYQYKFNLVLKEIKKSKYRITYANNKTGHITYVKNGITESIYVFKGKNSKGARK